MQSFLSLLSVGPLLFAIEFLRPWLFLFVGLGFRVFVGWLGVLGLRD